MEIETKTDCRSEMGITVGLIDALISISRVLYNRDLMPLPMEGEALAVQESLIDLNEDENIRYILRAARHAKKFRKKPKEGH